MAEQTLVPENSTELFRSRVTGNLRSQLLQTSPVAARQYCSPGIPVGFICKSDHANRLGKRLSKRGNPKLNDWCASHDLHGFTSRFWRISFPEFRRERRY